jgi:hypothetical protein
VLQGFVSSCNIAFAEFVDHVIPICRDPHWEAQEANRFPCEYSPYIDYVEIIATDTKRLLHDPLQIADDENDFPGQFALSVVSGADFLFLYLLPFLSVVDRFVRFIKIVFGRRWSATFECRYALLLFSEWK